MDNVHAYAFSSQGSNFMAGNKTGGHNMYDSDLDPDSFFIHVAVISRVSYYTVMS